ncbi:MAG: DUF2851 family protein [Bacteroidetes bacterium]|nr:DUF2851 family protein [Bacteroidota bacterium]MBT6687996.1 DUF2851 family protein [Bacteroidota bacterium]MBT7144939.1 DUF2851 family protein [Bacteroidota bacterium]MBT7492109.1 DUF2851 family protein [Bacteroidota bacterium]
MVKSKNIKSTEDRNIEIIDVGTQNFDAGPDFMNSKIKIEGTLWAGSVEIHLKSSDWKKHNHHKNKAYDNVILHLVRFHDEKICRTNGELIETAILDFDEKIWLNYDKLILSELKIPCQNKINMIENFVLDYWLNTLVFERLEQKSGIIRDSLDRNENNWEETFYQKVAKNFGLKINTLPFEMLAKSLPMKYLGKHKNNLSQLEAMLFGQAGFLEEEIPDNKYYTGLKKEYGFLAKKFGLKPMKKHLWKFLRLRPQNFPTIRIAQFAMLIYKSSSLFSKVIESTTIDELKTLFEVETSEFWKTHYVFEKDANKKNKKFGNMAISVLIINTVIPFLFVYGKSKNEESFQNRAIDFLENMNPEKNSIISMWKSLGFSIQNAFDSQALLQLQNEYCSKKRCIECQIGNKLIVSKDEYY